MRLGGRHRALADLFASMTRDKRDEKCPVCNGAGRIFVAPRGGIVRKWVTCYLCKGSGK